MYVDIKRSKGKNPTTLYYLRESVRVGKQVMKKTIANLSGCSIEVIEAIQFALQNKDKISVLGLIDPKNVTNTLGKKVGGLNFLYQVANKIGLVQTLGSNDLAKHALAQVLLRVLNPGISRNQMLKQASQYDLSILGLKELDKHTLYESFEYLSTNQARIEKKLYEHLEKKPDDQNLYLYDVTSSYLEGKKNAFAAYGYNRDGKEGKKQIVIGLLCNSDGVPLSIEVFDGNTSDTQTVPNQIAKIKQKYQRENFILVGDRGMIKGPQRQVIEEDGYHYITGLSKVEITTLLQEKQIQLGIFDETLQEFTDESNNKHYTFRKNPLREEEIRLTRKSKEEKLQLAINNSNEYLQDHPKAEVSTQLKHLNKKLEKYHLSYISIESSEGSRTISLKMDLEKKKKVEKLDGCYVLIDNLPSSNKEEIHERYKSLSKVEKAFRTSKSDLDLRPIFVRKEDSTRAHALVNMLSYRILLEAKSILGVSDINDFFSILTEFDQVKESIITINNAASSIKKYTEPPMKMKDVYQAQNFSLPKS